MITEIINSITGAFSDLMSSMIETVTSGFDTLVWTTGENGERVLSSIATYGLCFIGLGLAVGLVWFVIGLVKGN